MQTHDLKAAAKLFLHALVQTALTLLLRAREAWERAQRPHEVAQRLTPRPRPTMTPPVAIPAQRTADMGLADAGSIIPPNVERAVRAVLATSGRLALAAAELERFLVGLGLSRGDARSVVLRSTARAQRSQLGKADLPELQTLVTRTWIDGMARADRAGFIERLGLELGVELRDDLDAEALAKARARLTSALTGRGWSAHAAEVVVTSALGRAAMLLVVPADGPRACA